MTQTFLDIGILAHFSIIFVLLFVFVIVFGILETVKAFGEGKKGLNAIIALFVALIFVISTSATAMISTMVPWFIVLAIFVFFVMFLLRMWGLGDSDFKSLIGDSDVYPWLIILIVIVLLVSLSGVFGQSLLEKGGGKTNTGVINGTGNGSIQTTTVVSTTPDSLSTTTPSFSTNLLNTMRNPKVLGMIFVFLIGAFCLLFLTKMAKP